MPETPGSRLGGPLKKARTPDNRLEAPKEWLGDLRSKVQGPLEQARGPPEAEQVTLKQDRAPGSRPGVH